MDSVLVLCSPVGQHDAVMQLIAKSDALFLSFFSFYLQPPSWGQALFNILFILAAATKL